MTNESASMNQRLHIVDPGELKPFLQVLRSDILEEVDTKFQKGIDRIFSELGFNQRKPENAKTDKSSAPKESPSPKELPQKEFVLRNSPLTNLWGDVGTNSLYNGFCTFCVMVFAYIAAFYYFNEQRRKTDLAVMFWAFREFHIVSAMLLAINFSIVILLYPTFRFWATRRTFVKRKSVYDAIFICLFILYEAGLLLIPPAVIVVYNVPPGSAFIALVEKSRLLMKSYAFVRENITRALKYKAHQDGDKADPESSPCPKLEKLIYFLFVPTLVYRDNYPRTSRIRWSFVVGNLLQMICTIIFAYVSYICFAVGTLSKAGVEPIPLAQFIGTLALSTLVGSIVMLVSFYSSLHCWQNCIAEMLRFGDRMFYGDWWNCTSYAKFYRSWNMVVHDWLYTYIYRDMYVVLGKSRSGALLAVFLISAVIHDYILAVCLKFVFPLLFMLFSTFGVILVFITRHSTSNFWNFLIWCSLTKGYGILVLCYSLEWYARINCPRKIDSWLDYVVPRSFQCKLISL